MPDVIRYECVAKTHQHGETIRESGLTVHRGGWAYCDTEASDIPHQWIATGGISLERLVRRPRRPGVTETTI
jgi:hypothetical protein